MKTTRAVQSAYWYGVVTVPAGTEVMPVQTMGNTFYAVKHEEDAMRCGMNRHDAAHRYLFVPEDAVDKGAP